jgi:hypothetical protein
MGAYSGQSNITVPVREKDQQDAYVFNNLFHLNYPGHVSNN